MSNKDLFNFLTVSGEFRLTDDNKMYYESLISNRRDIGDYFKKFRKLPGADTDITLKIIHDIILRFNMIRDEIDILYKRFKVVYELTNHTIRLQIVHIVRQLEFAKTRDDIKLGLYKCNISGYLTSGGYDLGGFGRVYLIREHGLDVRYEDKEIKDVAYVLANTGKKTSYEFITQKEASLRREADMYRFKIYL